METTNSSTVINQINLSADYQEFMREHLSRQIDFRGFCWKYIICGKGGPPLLLLPGAFRCADSAFNFIRMFESDFTVIVPNYPPVSSAAEMTSGIIHILDHENISTVYILGQSYGGWMAQLLIRCYPMRFSKLVLSSTGPLTVSTTEKLLLPLLLRILPLLSESFLRQLLKKGFRSELDNFPELERPFWAAFSTDLFARLTKADMLSHFLVAEDAIRQGLMYSTGHKCEWKGDILIVGANDDQFVSDKDREMLLHIYPQARMTLIPNAGHTAVLTEPIRFACTVRNFLDCQSNGNFNRRKEVF